LFLESFQDGKIYTVTTWTNHIPVVLPPVDFVIVNKKYDRIFKTIEESGLIPYEEIMEKFGSFFKDFNHEIPNLKIIHQYESDCIRKEFNRLKIWKTANEFGKLIEKDGFVNVKPEEETKSILEFRDKIFPWIKVISGKKEDNPGRDIILSGENSPIYQKWLGELAIFYALDQGDHFRIILNKDIETKITVEQLHQIAVENLEREIEFKLVDSKFGGNGLVAGGDHEAGSICLPHIWDWCSDVINDNLVVSIPAKDMVMMAPASDSEKINNLKNFIVEFFKDGERLLTKQLFIFHKEEKKWDLYES
jgi:uncharacterized protein YtpQ (UPF0354 family)